MVPVRRVNPPLLSNKSSILQWGSLIELFSRYDLEDRFTIFLYPSILLAINGKNPKFSLKKNLICVPIIGWVPTFEIFSANSKAPQRLDESLNPIAGTLFILQ